MKVSSLATVRRIKHLPDKEERMEPIVITLGKPMVEIEIPKPLRFTVWVGGVDDNFDTFEEASAAAQEWLDKGYTDVQVEVSEDWQPVRIPEVLG